MRNAEEDLAAVATFTIPGIPSNCLSELTIIEKHKVIYWINRAQELERQVDSMKGCINCGQDRRFCMSGNNLKFAECWSNNYKHWVPKQPKEYADEQ